MTSVLVVAEPSTDGVKPATLSALAMAKKVAAATGGQITVLALGGPGTKAAARELGTFGAAAVLLCEDASLSNYVAERYAPTVAEVGKSFDLVLATASSFGKDLMPRVAARLDASFAGDCADVSVAGGTLTFKRPMYAGNVYGYVQLTTKIKVATARQSEFEPAQPSGGSSPAQDVACVAPGAAAGRVEFVSLDQVKSERPELTDARVIVSGGRACKERFFEVLDPLAETLRAAVGASRAACDAGYAPGDYQVGQTGKIVAPELYFAIGISGAIQHIAGMKNSKTIVAINTDPEAPIFQISDYGLVQDLFTAVPELVKELQARAK